MDQYKYQEQQKSQEKQKSEVASDVQYGKKCPNCGHMCDINDTFCVECGFCLSGGECPSCGITVQPNWEICPSCGHPLHGDACSFCGAHLDEQDTFCTECGNPRGGIECPKCHTLNFRSFCRNCNKPLNDMAQREVEKALKDPKFQRMLTLAKELAALEDQIMEAQEQGSSETAPELPQLSEEDRAMLDQYRDLINMVRNIPDAPEQKQEKPKQQQKERKQLSVNSVSLEETIAIYKSKVAEMQKAMSELIPDPGSTPQEQRNYYSARKLPVLTTRKERVPEYWVCNLCGCYHNQPSECAEPELGGTWTYRDITVVEKTYQYQDE